MSIRFKVEGMDKLQKKLKQLGDVPQKYVTQSSRKAMRIALKAAKQSAPEDTGELKRGIIMVGERSRVKGKKVYRIVFDRSKNDIFQKKDESGNVIAYYPASQEYGFFTRNGKYIPGYHFLEKALTGNAKKIEKTIVDEMLKRIEKAMKG